MTTVAVGARPAPPAPGPGYQVLAADLLRDSGIRLRPAVYPEAAAYALAQALVRCEPDSPHRRLLLAALRKRSAGEKKRDGARPIQERAVRVLLMHGQVPTPGAAAGWVRQHEQRRAAQAARAVRLAPLIARDAPRALAEVEACWRNQGTGPTPGDLKRAMRWRPQDLAAILEGLEASGVLVYDRSARVLRPGPRGEQGAG